MKKIAITAVFLVCGLGLAATEASACSLTTHNCFKPGQPLTNSARPMPNQPVSNAVQQANARAKSGGYFKKPEKVCKTVMVTDIVRNSAGRKVTVTVPRTVCSK